jgi:hypothetical protein
MAAYDPTDRELLEYLHGTLAAHRRREIERQMLSDGELVARVNSVRKREDMDNQTQEQNMVASVSQAVAQTTRSKQFHALRDDIRADRVVAFVGPGLAQSAGLAHRDEISTALARRVAHRLSADDAIEVQRLKNLGLQSLSELFVHHFGRPQLNQAITEALYGRCPAGELDLGLHKMVLEIPFAMIVSTNWDDLFEQAGRELDPPLFLDSITDDEELLGLYSPHCPMLIQPRGSLRKGNAVVSEHIGAVHDARHPGLCAFLRSLFFTHRVLFLGFGDRDPGLLYYYHLLRSQLGNEAQQVWATSYVFAPTMARAGTERLQQMGLSILECAMPSSTFEGSPSILHETVATESFLRALRGETRPVVNRVQRSKRIADCMGESEFLSQDLRGRAGLSPIGLPDKKQLEAEGCSSIPSYMSLPAEYAEQERLKDGFLNAIHGTVASGHEVKLILSTDFESIQDRAKNKKWVWLQLKNLVDFFETAAGRQASIKVVDRQGPFEMQQYILGEGELAESVKFDVHDPTYYYARTTKNPRETKTAKRLFDVCFAGLATRNLENMLSVYNDPGRNSLVQAVVQSLRTGQASEVIRDVESLDPLAAKLAEVLRNAAGTDREQLDALSSNVENSLTTAPPQAVMSVLSEKVVFQAIKEHLVAQWKHEMEMLGETRPEWIIQLTDRNGASRGELKKASCHRNLYGRLESELYNLHVAAFALTSDTRRLILRKRRDDGPYFDPGKWDRTFTGHVRKDSTYAREFMSEVVDHVAHCGVHGCSFVMRAQFMEYCQRRAQQAAPGGTSSMPGVQGTEVVAFPLRAEPVPGVYRRVRAEDSEAVIESARSMIYLCIMPRKELPTEDPSQKHFADWVELSFDQIRQMLSTNSPIVCKTVVTGADEEIGRATMTEEAWTLLKMCYDDVLIHL